MKYWLVITYLILFIGSAAAQNTQSSFKIAKLKYEGGGDWYANPSSLPNLFKFIRENTRMNVHVEEETVDPASGLLFQYPMSYMTGHGNVVFTDMQAKNLRKYLLAGGFLLIDDNYGLNKYAVREIKKIFPEYELKELPFSHPIYHQHFNFPNGMPKIHEHDGKPAQAFGIIHEGRLLLMLTFETDLGDGWEDAQVHNDPEEVRRKALQMGTNIVMYILNN